MKLTNPIKANGENIDELNFDFEKFSVSDYARAEVLAKKLMGEQVAPAIETTSSFYLSLGILAACRSDKRLDVEDLRRDLKGPDIVRVVAEGYRFLGGSGDSEPAT